MIPLSLQASACVSSRCVSVEQFVIVWKELYIAHYLSSSFLGLLPSERLVVRYFLHYYYFKPAFWSRRFITGLVLYIFAFFWWRCSWSSQHFEVQWWFLLVDLSTLCSLFCKARCFLGTRGIYSEIVPPRIYWSAGTPWQGSMGALTVWSTAGISSRPNSTLLTFPTVARGAFGLFISWKCRHQPKRTARWCLGGDSLPQAIF